VTPGSVSVELGPGQRITAGDIAARIDRLPLTRTQYGYSAITQWFWGIMIAADGLVAVLYPFVCCAARPSRPSRPGCWPA
jgi:hypothetical protein